MKPRERKQLLREIARCVEAAYRRGFHQGHEAGAAGRRLALELEHWRFKVPLHLSRIPFDGFLSTAEERLQIEHPHIVDIVDRLARSEQPPP